MRTLLDLMQAKSNDYSELEERFRKITGDELVGFNLSNSNFYNTIKKSYSVVVPSYRYHKYLKGLLHSLDNQTFRKRFEVIVIDDGSASEVRDLRKFEPTNYDLEIIRKNKRLGRAVARNIGIAHAKGDVITFVDSDMILPNNFVMEHFGRVATLPNVVLAGFYQNIMYSEYSRHIKEIEESGFAFNADFHADFRSEKTFSNDILVHSYGVKPENIGKKYALLEETDNLKSFGFGSKYGVWKLSMVALSVSLTTSRKMIMNAGGFDSRFRGWGFEDVHFGAKLIASGAYIVPSYNVVSYRIKHPVRQGSIDRKTKEAITNKALYEKLLNEEFSPVKNHMEFYRRWRVKGSNP